MPLITPSCSVIIKISRDGSTPNNPNRDEAEYPLKSYFFFFYLKYVVTSGLSSLTVFTL